METKNNGPRIIISGGGTGGHIFPAVSIADRFRARYPDAEILFVGAEGRMEMTRVPEAGYRIIGLPIAGIQRSLSLSNLAVPFKLAASLWRARKVVRDFRPDIAVGTGGYASGPVLFAASMAGVPTLIQEQNGFAGVTNKILAKRAAKICVAYEGLERVFPKDKIVLTGNPVRASILDGKKSRQEALDEFSLSAGRKTFLVLGGSLGARAVNNAVFESIDTLASDGSQLLWQCGKLYYNQYRRELDRLVAEHPEKDLENRVALVPFISDMNAAYSVADFIISRAGAGTISELCIVGKPSVLIPSPNVAEDHQRHNAQALSSKGAAVFIPESENLSADLSLAAARLLSDASLCSELSRNISSMARPDATSDIVDEIEKLLPAI